MSINKLYLFSKDTDATAALRGYHYQTLKTLETWLDNYLQKIDDEIYCDYEDDIFQKALDGKVKFRQLKLYSSNFSFKSGEIKKCIAHFFMLHIKTDYQFREKEFIFEANTAIAGNYKNNDAELLKQWFQNQNNLSRKLLSKCSKKVKSIISNYVKQQVKQLTDIVPQVIISDAVSVLKEASENDWNEFTKNVRWKFLDKPADEEFAYTINNIENLILKLPFPVGKENLQSAFGILYKAVSLKSTAPKPEERKLVLSELERLILDVGTTEDKWYGEIYEKWRSIKKIERFNVGELYEILNAVRYCRRHAYLTTHDEHWLALLKIFISNLPIINEFRRSAIYEYLWLKFRPDKEFKLPTGNLIGTEDLIKFYFSDFKEFHNAQDLENAQNLLNIIFTANSYKKVNIDSKELKKWYRELYKNLNSRLKKEKDPNEQCQLLEGIGTYDIFASQYKTNKSETVEVLKAYEDILKRMDGANFYNVTGLADRINQYIILFIKIGVEEKSEIIQALQKFSEKLDPIVQKRDGAHKAAKVQVERGSAYLKSQNPELLLSALTCFHKAKSLWIQQETIEGFVLTLINISQLYNAIGMNVAAKYYALCGAWVSINNGDKKLLKRIADSFALVFHSDFVQGSWMNTISDFEMYVKARFMFNPHPIDETDEISLKTIADYSLMIFSMRKISVQFQGLTDTLLLNSGYIGEDYIQPSLKDALEKKCGIEESLREWLEVKLQDTPLNDIGKKRIIRFHALGSSWQIIFKNDFRTNSISEEFCAVLQIMLSEIALSKKDFHLLKSDIKIELEESLIAKQPEQLPSNQSFIWKIFVQFLDSSDVVKINFNAAQTAGSLLYILLEISLLKQEELKELFAELFTQQSLAEKTLSVNSYQRIYRFLWEEKDFDQFKREFFQPVDFVLNLPKDNPTMKWKADLSEKYDYNQALVHIRGRFKNTHKCIYLTLSELKKDKKFHDYINLLRKEGWLDWQIILAILNYILNYKSNIELSKMEFKSERERFDSMQVTMDKYLKMDEKEFYVEFPLEAFQTKDFRMHLEHYPIYVLRVLGLEYRARFPNFSSIKEFLDIRFNMRNDITNEGNPLYDIPT